MGITGKEKKLFGSYIPGRKQRVKINNITCQDVKYGMPQGSRLGLLFFIMCVNSFVQLCRAVTFTDERIIICERHTYEQAKQNVESGLRKIYSWLVTNTLKLKIDKTKYMTFGNYKR